METPDLEPLRQAMQAAPENPDSRQALLQALVAAEVWEEAEEVGEALLRTASPPAAVHALMGTVYGKRDRWDDAVQQCRIAFELQPDDPLLLYNLGTLLAQQGDIDAAVTHLKNATTQRETWAEAHYNLGAVLLRQKCYTEAVEAFERAINLCDVYPEANFNSGNAHAMLGLGADGGLDYYEVDCAINAYKLAIQQRPGGGGGYSGGGGGGTFAGAGGGGSINLGTAQDNSPGVKSGDGQVIIAWQPPQ